jgi:hypothetical protein
VPTIGGGGRGRNSRKEKEFIHPGGEFCLLIKYNTKLHLFHSNWDFLFHIPVLFAFLVCDGKAFC